MAMPVAEKRAHTGLTCSTVGASEFQPKCNTRRDAGRNNVFRHVSESGFGSGELSAGKEIPAR